MGYSYFTIAGPRVRVAFPNAEYFINVDGVEALPCYCSGSKVLTPLYQAAMMIKNCGTVKFVDIVRMNENQARWDDFTITLFEDEKALDEFINQHYQPKS
jgi:hypothetical protein